MNRQRKITVLVPEDLLASAQAETGTGVTETVREGLKKLASLRAQRELLALRGKVKVSMTWEDSERGPPVIEGRHEYSFGALRGRAGKTSIR